MKEKKDKEAPEKKELLNSQIELLNIKMQELNRVNEIMVQRRREIENTINLIALELEVPEEQLGEWGLGQDGRSIIRFGKRKKFPGLKTVKKRAKELKNKAKTKEPDEEE